VLAYLLPLIGLLPPHPLSITLLTTSVHGRFPYLNICGYRFGATTRFFRSLAQRRAHRYVDGTDITTVPADQGDIYSPLHTGRPGGRCSWRSGIATAPVPTTHQGRYCLPYDIPVRRRICRQQRERCWAGRNAPLATHPVMDYVTDHTGRRNTRTEFPAC